MNYRILLKYKAIKCNFMMGILIACSIFLNFACADDKAKANRIRTEECRRLAFLQYNRSASGSSVSEEEKALFGNSSIRLAYTCSHESGGTPSCREFYAREPEQVFLEEICPPGYRKFSARCSRQNFLGECRILDTVKERYERRIYAKPNDGLNEAKDDCLVAGGRFVDREGENLFLPLLAACELN